MGPERQPQHLLRCRQQELAPDDALATAAVRQRPRLVSSPRAELKRVSRDGLSEEHTADSSGRLSQRAVAERFAGESLTQEDSSESPDERAPDGRVSRDRREDGSGEGKVGRVGQVRREGGDGVEEAGQLRRPGATDGGSGVDEGDTGEPTC